MYTYVFTVYIYNMIHVYIYIIHIDIHIYRHIHLWSHSYSQDGTAKRFEDSPEAVGSQGRGVEVITYGHDPGTD